MKESGIGRENGIEALEACMFPSCALRQILTSWNADSQAKSTIVNIASSEETREMQDWFAETDEEKRYG